MKIIRNKYIPFGYFTAMNILGLLFVKEHAPLYERDIRHEAIHSAQQYEILTASAIVSLVLSCIWTSWWYLLITIAMPILLYIGAWLIELVLPPYKTAYKDSPFEREAYMNERDPEYLANRPLFAWVKYFIKDRLW